MGFVRFLVISSLVAFMAGCASKDLTSEKSRSPTEIKQLRDRLSSSQIDR